MVRLGDLLLLYKRHDTVVNRMRYTSTALVALLIAALLAASPTDTFAQANSSQNTSAQSTKPPAKATRNKRQFLANNKADWKDLADGVCKDETATNACAQAAIVQVTTECAASARFFQRATIAWQILDFALIISSAGFTAVGASTTIANAKIYSTLGGTTGLGAVTSTIITNAAGDQVGLAKVNATLQNFLTYVQTGGASKAAPAGAGAPNAAGAPSDADIYRSAPIYAAQCVAAATGSSGTASK